MSYFNKKKFTMRQVVGLLTGVFLGITVIAYASTVTFTAGTTISSTAVKGAIDSNKSVAICSAQVWGVTLGASNTDINSVAITVPGPGMILVSGDGTFGVNNSGLSWQADAWITDTSGGSAISFAGSFWQGVPGLPSGFYYSPFHNQRIFTVGAAGTYTYYLTGKYFTTVADVYYSNICAIFTPS